MDETPKSTEAKENKAAADYIKDARQGDARILLAKNIYGWRGWAIFWIVMLVVLFLLDKYTGTDPEKAGFRLLLSIAVGLLARFAYLMSKASGMKRISNEAVRAAWLKLGGF